MSLVTATPRGQRNGQVLREFVDSIGTASVTYTYPTAQEWLSVRNTGIKDITVTVGGVSQTIQPGVKWERSVSFSSFDIVSTNSVQSFEAVADESGSTFDTPEGKYFSSIGFSSPANTIVLLGDSITNQNTVAGHWSDRGYFVWANAFLGQAFNVLKNAGVGGERTDQFLARLDTDVFSYKPAWCMVFGGTNDVIQSKDADTIFNNLKAIYDKLLNKGIRVIASTVPPTASFDTQTKKDAYYKLNRKLKEYAKSNYGIILVDMGSAYANPADTTAIAGTVRADDLLHPSAYGAARMGEVLFNELKKHIPLTPSTLSFSKDDSDNLLGNGVMFGTTGQLSGATGVVADNWVLVGVAPATVASSKVARTDTLSGEWQRINIATGSTTGFSQFYREITTGFAVGDTIFAEMEIKVDPTSVVTERIDVLVEFKDTSNAVISSAGALFHESAMPILNYAPKDPFIVRTPNVVIPANTTKVRLISKAYMTTGNIDYGRAAIRKAT